MRRYALFILMIALAITGCATTETDKAIDEKILETARTDPFEKGLQSVENGLNARKQGDMTNAGRAFQTACMYFREANEEQRTIMLSASTHLKRIISVSGFEYASKDSFESLALYLDMQIAYMDGDIEDLKSTEKQFYKTVQRVQETTVTEKQKRLTALNADVTHGIKELQNQHGDPTIFEIYPMIYVVKGKDSLPKIASRHDIYNDSFMWPLIYKANRDQIKDPKIIYTGQDLKIPRDMTLEEIIAARREAGAPDPEKIPKDAFMPQRKK